MVLYFQESAKMEAAYGLAITIAMLMTSILLFHYLKYKGWNMILVWAIMLVFFTVESSFLFANLTKFFHGGFFTVMIASLVVALMFTCFRGGKITKSMVTKVKIDTFSHQLKSLSRDTTLPKYCTHLIYLSKVKNDDEVESVVLHSILQKRPKRADFYWFVNVDVTDEPYTMEYKVNIIEKDDLIKVRFRLGFKVQQKISYYLRLVIEDMVKNHEINLDPYYHGFSDKKQLGDFRFVIIEEEISQENELPLLDSLVMKAYYWVRKTAASPDRWFGLDYSMVTYELVPVVIKKPAPVKLNRIY
jgi:KUP system potassium uptake protein